MDENLDGNFSTCVVEIPDAIQYSLQNQRWKRVETKTMVADQSVKREPSSVIEELERIEFRLKKGNYIFINTTLNRQKGFLACFGTDGNTSNEIARGVNRRASSPVQSQIRQFPTRTVLFRHGNSEPSVLLRCLSKKKRNSMRNIPSREDR